jgi:hypothetical protein
MPPCYHKFRREVNCWSYIINNALAMEKPLLLRLTLYIIHKTSTLPVNLAREFEKAASIV